MNAKIYSQENKEMGNKELPAQFDEPVRLDLIKKAVLAIQSNSRQRYGADPRAGKRHSAKLSRRRRKYRGGYGFGMARIPRKILSRNGTRFNWVGAIAPNAVGGRSPHAPTAEKIFTQKINDKERKKAIRSALAATLDSKIVSDRGHKVPANYPFVLADEFESIAKTKALKTSFETLGLIEELDRSLVKKVRAGKGTMRNRRYKKKVGPLVVVSSDCDLKSARNLPGVKAIQVTDLNANLLAPGCHVGRLTLFTAKALDEMKEKKLFM